MNLKTLLAAGAAMACAGALAADFDITLDPGKKPIRDARQSTCGPLVGYAGCFSGLSNNDKFYFEDNREATSAICRESGAWFQRMWSANGWFAHRKPNPFDPNSKDPKEVKRYKGYCQSRPDLAFKFWQDNGIKVLFTLEAWGGDKSKQEIIEFVDFIVSNKYEKVIAGFELGNETYFGKPESMPALCKTWNEVIPEIKKRMPKVDLGIPICEYFELNPDLAQIRARCTDKEAIKMKGYFSARRGSQTSAAMILCMSNTLKDVSHVIYHAYGAETPYSCSYYGFQRFRNFAVGFPEIKDKKFWLSEIRPRSDEDNRCQRIFREALISAHYALMAICQPDMDGYNHHQFSSLAGAFYESTGKSWRIQWRDAGGEYPDRRAPEGRPRFDLGSMGAMYRILAEAILDHPIFLEHGTSKEQGTEDTFFTSARVCDQVYARRRALKEGKTAFLGLFGGVPEVEGEVEWVAALSKDKSELCLMMVNSKNEEMTCEVTLKDRQFAAPTYITLSCPEEFVDCRAVPGEGRFWKQVSWEDTQSGYDVVRMERYEGMKPKCDTLKVKIGPHTVQSVTVRTRGVPKKK